MKNQNTMQLILLPEALNETNPNRSVSTRSRWRDGIWRLDFNYFGAPSHGAVIPWHSDIDEYLVEIFKKTVWSALVEPAGRRMTTSSFAHYSTGIGILGRFMTRWEHADLTHFDVKAVGFLTQELAEMAQCVDEEQFDDTDTDVAADDDEAAVKATTAECADLLPYTEGKLSFSVIETVFGFVAMIFRQRKVLRKMGVTVSEEDPLGGDSPRDWALRVRAPNPKLAHALPDEIAIPLMIAADRLLGDPADEVIALQTTYLDSRGTRLGDNVSDGQRFRANLALKDHSFAVLPGETAPWHPPLPVIRSDGDEEAIPHTIADLVRTIRDTCVITLLQQTGMRIGEIVTLRTGTNTTTGLPSCVARRRSASGNLDLFYAESVVNKGRAVPEPEIWLLGSVPAGSNSLPMTVRAIQVLNTLLDPWRDLAINSRTKVSLLVCLVASGLPEFPGGVNPPTVNNVSRGVKQTYARLLDWSTLPDTARNGDDLRKYKTTKGFCIAASQWRKTFATNMVRINSRLLNALRRHFKHMNLATTESDYVGDRVQLLEDVDDAQMTMTIRFLRERTRNAAPTIGRTGSVVRRNIARMRLLDEGGHPLLGDSLQEALKASEMGLFHADHGCCAVSLSPTKARCHELAGDVSFLHDRPNYEYQRPEVCAGCPCFVADVGNLPYWRQRFIENNAAKRAYSRIGDGVAASVFEAKARQARSVVRALRKMKIAARRNAAPGRLPNRNKP